MSEFFLEKRRESIERKEERMEGGKEGGKEHTLSKDTESLSEDRSGVSCNTPITPRLQGEDSTVLDIVISV